MEKLHTSVIFYDNQEGTFSKISDVRLSESKNDISDDDSSELHDDEFLKVYMHAYSYIYI